MIVVKVEVEVLSEEPENVRHLDVEVSRRTIVKTSCSKFAQRLQRPADVTLLDLERRVVVDPDTFVSRGRNTPFAGWELTGSATTTIVSGRVVWTRE